LAYLPANFGFSTFAHIQVRSPYETDGQTERRTDRQDA